MSKALANPKLFAAAGLLFAVATIVNATAASTCPYGNSGLSLSPAEKIAPAETKSSPTIPPDPWTNPPTRSM